jgi:hypothetical protein
LFPLFATGVIDTGGKFATGVVDAGGKSPPVSLTPAEILSLVSLTPTTTLAKLVANLLTLTCEYLHEFSKKFKTVLMGYSGAGGKLIHKKYQKPKILTLSL